MHVWQIQEAKAKLTQLLRESSYEPQIISRHGIPETIVMSLALYHQILGQKMDLVSLMKQSPLYGVDLTIERDDTPGRDIGF